MAERHDGAAPRHAIRLIAAALVLAAAAAGYFYFIHAPRRPAPAAPAVAGGAPPVTVSQPLVKDIVEWNEYTGQFEAVEYVEVRARVSGYLTEIAFEDGQMVRKGDLLFIVDPRPYQVALDSAKAQLTQAEARAELANRQLGRAAELRTKDFVPAATYDERNNELRQSQGAIAAATAQIHAAELDLEFTHVTAPVTGRISRRNVSVGNLVIGGNAGNATLLTTIVSLDPIYLDFDMSEADYLAYQRSVADGKLTEARQGTLRVQSRLTDETRWTREGQLDFVDNQVDRGAGTLRARAVFDNPDLFITPGQFARLRLPGSERHQAIMVPDAAIVTDQSRKLVMTVAPDGTVVPKPVETGPLVDGLRVIRNGLSAGDRVIINGLMRARPGAKVTPEPGKIEEAAGES